MFSAAPLKDRGCAMGKNAVPKYVRDYNKEFALVVIGGHARIAHFKADGSFTLLTVDTARALKRNHRRMTDRGETQSFSDLWFDNPDRRTYPNGIVFAPNQLAPDGTLNTWRGFGVVAREGDVEPFLSFVRDVICAGNAD